MEQVTDFTTITACGECCTGCKQRINGICKGCIEADGYVPEWADSGRCKVHECARKHNVQFGCVRVGSEGHSSSHCELLPYTA